MTEALEAARSAKQWIATIEERKTTKPLSQFVSVHAPQLDNMCRALLAAYEALESIEALTIQAPIKKIVQAALKGEAHTKGQGAIK